MKKIGIIIAPNVLNKEEQVKTALSPLGNFDFVIIRKGEIEKACKETPCDLYIDIEAIVRKEHLDYLPAENLIVFTQDWRHIVHVLIPHKIVFLRERSLRQEHSVAALQHAATCILTPELAKKCCIAFLEAEPTNDQFDIYDELMIIAPLRFTFVETQALFIEICAKETFDLYMINAAMYTPPLDDSLGMLPDLSPEKVVICSADPVHDNTVCFTHLMNTELVGLKDLVPTIKKILELPSTALKSICIGYTNDQVNTDVEKIQTALQKLGTFDYTIIETADEIKKICSEKKFDLYIIEARMIASSLEEALQIIPKERLYVMNSDGALASTELIPAGIYHTKTPVSSSQLRTLSPQFKKMLNLN